METTSAEPADPTELVDLDRLAMSAIAHDPFLVDVGTEPFGGAAGGRADLLPDWYMPAPQMSASDRTPRRVAVVGVIILALLLLNAAGLCTTYGLPEIAW